MSRCDSRSAPRSWRLSCCRHRGLRNRPSHSFPSASGTAAARSRAPMVSRDPAQERDAWRRDLATIKSLGFNSVKTWVDWASAEPERGRYRFDALDQLLSLADEAGLKVIVQIYTDAAPEWLGKRLSGFELRHRSGGADRIAGVAGLLPRSRRRPRRHGGVHRRACGGGRQAPVLLRDRRLERAAHRQLGVVQHAGRVLLLPAHAGAVPRLAEDAKYRTLDALNAAWYRTFTSWDQLEAPRFGTILSYTDFIDWKTFVANKLAGGSEDQGGRVGSARRARRVEPLRCAGRHAQPALGIRQSGRLVDDARGRSLRDVDLSEARGGRDAVVARAADVGARRHSIRGARQGLVDRRAAGRAGGDRACASRRRSPVPICGSGAGRRSRAAPARSATTRGIR